MLNLPVVLARSVPRGTAIISDSGTKVWTGHQDAAPWKGGMESGDLHESLGE